METAFISIIISDFREAWGAQAPVKIWVAENPKETMKYVLILLTKYF